MYSLYTKPYKNPTDLITKLQSQNLIISDESKANEILSKINYFRFKIYLRPFFDMTTKQFRANSKKELNSWLKLTRDVRNRVAHHSRVWNCNYREPHGIRQSLSGSLQASQPNKIYLFFVILETLHQKQIVEKDIKVEIKMLLQKYPAVNNFINSMGIPQGWIV